MGNCDEFLYMGGNERDPLMGPVSKLLGKETIDTNTYGQSKEGAAATPPTGTTGRELLMPDASAYAG